MNVLTVIPSFYGSSGDAVNERQLIIALSKKVDRCYVITFPSLREALRLKHIKRAHSLPKNIMTIELPIPHRYLITTFSRIAYSYLLSIIGFIFRLHKRVDLIYIRESSLALGFLIFKSFANRTVIKIPAIIEDEVRTKGITQSIVKNTSYVLDRIALMKGYKIAVPSILFYSEFIKKRKFKSDGRFLLLPPGIDVKMIEEIRTQKNKTSDKNDLIKVGFLGSLNWWQGVDILARGMGILKKEKHKIDLIFVGDGPLKQQIKQICERSAVSCEITGFIPHKEALTHLFSFNMMVLPRRRTTSTERILPIKVLEAWALEVPVIVTKHRIFIESNIRNLEHVVYCEPIPSDVAKAMLLVIKNKVIRDKLSKNGPKLAEEFSYDKIAIRLLEAVKPSI